MENYNDNQGRNPCDQHFSAAVVFGCLVGILILVLIQVAVGK